MSNGKPKFRALTHSRTVIEYTDTSDPPVTRKIDFPYMGNPSSVTENMEIRMKGDDSFRLSWVIHDEGAQDPLEEKGTGNGRFVLSAHHQWAKGLSWYDIGAIMTATGTEFTHSWCQLEVDPEFQFKIDGKTTTLYEQAAEQFKDRLAKNPELVRGLAENWGHDIEEVPNAYAVWLSEHLTEVHQDVDDPCNGFYSELIHDEAIKLWPEFMEYIVDPYVVPFEVGFPNRQYLTGSPHDWGDSPSDTEALWIPCDDARDNLRMYGGAPPEGCVDYEKVRVSEDPDQPGMWVWTLTSMDGVERKCDVSYASSKEAYEAAAAAETWASKHAKAVQYATGCMDEFFAWSRSENYLVFAVDGTFVDGVAVIYSNALEVTSVIGDDNLEQVRKEVISE